MTYAFVLERTMLSAGTAVSVKDMFHFRIARLSTADRLLATSSLDKHGLDPMLLESGRTTVRRMLPGFARRMILREAGRHQS